MPQKRTSKRVAPADTGDDSQPGFPAASEAEREFGNLTENFSTAQHLCIRLSNDGRIDRGTQEAYWTLSEACLLTMLRFDGSWTSVVDKAPVGEITKHRDYAHASATALKQAASRPSQGNLNTASSLTAFANAEISSLLDRTE